MRGFLTWVSGAAFAFFVTAGAFLLLANLGTGTQETALGPRADLRGSSGPALDLAFDEGDLEAARSAPDQRLSFRLSNGGERALSDISLTLEVSSEDTSLTDARYYEASVERLGAGEEATAEFDVVDLSPLAGGEEAGQERPRWIVEARATTPGGISAVRTAIVPSEAP